MNGRTNEISHVVETSAGMCGLWQPEKFSAVDELDDWEDSVADDSALLQCISDGEFVPLNVGGDGTFGVTVRRGELSAREAQFRLVSSDPYLLVSRGAVRLGGLENVGNYVGGGVEIPLPAGRYSVVVHLIDWEAEPGALSDDGEPTDSVLPDFVVEIAEEPDPAPSYRVEVVTFDPPSE